MPKFLQWSKNAPAPSAPHHPWPHLQLYCPSVTLLSCHWPPHYSSNTAGRFLPQDIPLLFPSLQNILTLDAHMAHSHIWLYFLMFKVFEAIHEHFKTATSNASTSLPNSLLFIFSHITLLPFYTVAILLFMDLLSVSSDQNVSSMKTGIFVCLVYCDTHST